MQEQNDEQQRDGYLLVAVHGRVRLTPSRPWIALIHIFRFQDNQKVKRESKGVRILPFFLPTKSPWLNPIESKWVHAKKAVVEPDGLLSAQQLAKRMCAHFGCSSEPPL